MNNRIETLKINFVLHSGINLDSAAGEWLCTNQVVTLWFIERSGITHFFVTTSIPMLVSTQIRWRWSGRCVKLTRLFHLVLNACGFITTAYYVVMAWFVGISVVKLFVWKFPLTVLQKTVGCNTISENYKKRSVIGRPIVKHDSVHDPLRVLLRLSA